MGKAQTHQVNIGKNDSWETPQQIFDEACRKYSVNPVLDVCATNTNHKLKDYFTENDDALDREWNRDFFMNPPYSEITQWMKKAWEQHQKHNVDALILTFTKTSTKWWHKYVEGKAETHFHEKRIRFLLDGAKPTRCKVCNERYTDEGFTVCCDKTLQKSSPTYDSVWVIYRKKENQK